MRGRRVVVCPETQQLTHVTVDALRAAVGAVREEPEIQLASCERFLDRPTCDQPCTAQIKSSPADTREANVLKHWFAGKSCALCARDIGPIHRGELRPGLIDPVTRHVVAWEDLPVEPLTRPLGEYLPICGDCQIAEGFREHFPQLVVERR